MKYPNFNEEKKLWRKGYKCVAGIDEAGRGPLAGPVVAGAVNFMPGVIARSEATKQSMVCTKNSGLPRPALAGLAMTGIKDSKKLTEKQREEIYEVLIKHPEVKWGIGIVSEKVIDKINILQATKLAMQKALIDLELSFPRKRESIVLAEESWILNQVGNDVAKIDFVLIDGNFKLDLKEAAFVKGYGAPKQKSIIFSIAAASIIAKVTRDRIMQKMHKKYPQYNFVKHKGYGTKAHFESLEKFGPCKIHRKTFWPACVCLQKKLK